MLIVNQNQIELFHSTIHFTCTDLHVDAGSADHLLEGHRCGARVRLAARCQEGSQTPENNYTFSRSTSTYMGMGLKYLR